MSMDKMYVFSWAIALEEILEICLRLIWTKLPAALYAAGWSDEVLGHPHHPPVVVGGDVQLHSSWRKILDFGFVMLIEARSKLKFADSFVPSGLFLRRSSLLTCYVWVYCWSEMLKCLPWKGSFQSSQPDLDLGRFLWRHRGLWPCLYARRCCIQHECMGEGAAWSQWQCPMWAMGLGIGILVERKLSPRVCCCLLIRPRKLEIASCSNNVFFVILSLPSSIIQRPEVILSLLTAFGGASVGPEPVVIIMPSVVYVALVKRVLNPSVHVLRIAALAGGAGGLAAFFGLPLASAFLGNTRRENRLKGWGRELNENWEASLGFWSSWFLF